MTPDTCTVDRTTVTGWISIWDTGTQVWPWVRSHDPGRSRDGQDVNKPTCMGVGQQYLLRLLSTVTVSINPLGSFYVITVGLSVPSQSFLVHLGVSVRVEMHSDF